MNIVVASSGGPTSAINASIAGVYLEAVKHSSINKIYGAFNGIEGILENRLVDLREQLNDDGAVELLKNTPSTVLGSCRYKLPKVEDDITVYEKVVTYFKEKDIGAFFYIGGNDSMDTVCKLSRYMKENNIDIKVIGIPKTIDNDLMYTDHTPGFGSAAKYVAATISEITRDSMVYSAKSVTIVEVMGRYAGWLTASSCVLKERGESAPHLIYLPEVPFSTEKFIEDIKIKQEKHKAVIIAVSEGVKNEEGCYVAECYQSGENDAFGHKYLAGVGKMLEDLVKNEIGCKVRSIELNVMQRCSSHIASKTDIDEAEHIGSKAVLAALNGETGKMMILSRVSNNPYKVEIQTIDVDDVANHVKYFPIEWINEDKNNVKNEAINYFLPLIQGELNIKMDKGIPVHFRIKK
ncbi:MAG: 6-phosphofructokinase [Clostridiales bacterium]|jgi:6-phosphofructokinase|nr:6-phosphofructokinase [Clostridiales bacterium]